MNVNVHCYSLASLPINFHKKYVQNLQKTWIQTWKLVLTTKEPEFTTPVMNVCCKDFWYTKIECDSYLFTDLIAKPNLS